MLILAPMQGLTELLFRKTYEKCFPKAIDYAISPFLSLTHGNLADAWKKIDDVIPELNADSIPVVPQILGKEPLEFVDLANRLYDVGYTEINWNIGCPMRKVAAKHRGSGILPYPGEVNALLDYVVPKMKGQLSVKMRLGHRSKDEILQLIPILNDYPIANVTIHPRTGKQQYSGEVDLDAFEQVIPQIRHKIIYNGDLCTLGDYTRLVQRFPSIKDYMIGRGVLYDPLLPLKIKGVIDADDKTQTLAASLTFISALTDAILSREIHDESKMRKIKEYWCLLRRSLPISELVSMKVLHAQSLGETLSEIHNLTHQSERADLGY
ncbi:MAG: tRNA-dihydrouridine synthase family protein [Bacteroidales bacterium]|nr:tRNA-dihydrouridine synthase family protein [Bacteroidales bacterium]